MKRNPLTSPQAITCIWCEKHFAALRSAIQVRVTPEIWLLNIKSSNRTRLACQFLVIVLVVDMLSSGFINHWWNGRYPASFVCRDPEGVYGTLVAIRLDNIAVNVHTSYIRTKCRTKWAEIILTDSEDAYVPGSDKTVLGLLGLFDAVCIRRSTISSRHIHEHSLTMKTNLF